MKLIEPKHFVSPCCKGEICGICFRVDHERTPATHKVEQTYLLGEPQGFHPFTQYICCAHFQMIIGPYCTWEEFSRRGT